MKGSDLFVKCLEHEGIKYIFGLPGEENIDFMDSLSRSKIKFITTRHEEGAAFMANVYGRVSGKPAICLATLGPGATNLITGVADANLDRAPLIAITGQLERKYMQKGSHQYIDIVGLFKHITKWNTSVKSPTEIPKIIRKACDIATTEKFGAVHIELPEDIAAKKTNLRPSKTASKKAIKNLYGNKDLNKAKDLIKKSKHPIILAGNGIIRANASSELLKLIKQTNIPVVTTFMGKGAIDARENLHIGTVGLNTKDYGLSGLNRADLVIAVGSDAEEYKPVVWNAERNKTIIHIDSETQENDVHYKSSVDLIGDVKETLKLLVDCCDFKKEHVLATELKEFVSQEIEHYHNDKSFPMKPEKVIHDIRQALKDDDILISDVGAHKVWLGRYYPAYKPGSFIVSNGMASMGIALPGAIGAKLAKPNRKVMAVCGDGGFLMNAQELETAARLGLDFVVVIFVDKKYSLIEWKQKNKFGKAFGTSFNNPDFVKLAESFGIKGYRVKKASELLPLLKKVVKSKGVHVVEVPVDSRENRNINKIGTVISN